MEEEKNDSLDYKVPASVVLNYTKLNEYIGPFKKCIRNTTLILKIEEKNSFFLFFWNEEYMNNRKILCGMCNMAMNMEPPFLLISITVLPKVVTTIRNSSGLRYLP